jgi:hypothetical protein
MRRAICIRCGGDKEGVFTACGRCGATPSAEDEFLLSLVLCEHLSSELQLAQFAREIKSGRRPTVSEPQLAHARRALDHPQIASLFEALLQRARASSAPECGAECAPIETKPEQQATINGPSNKGKETVLHRNPFWLLGVTTRDDRRRVVALAEEKSLELDHERCQKARSDLTNPRTRLTTEMAWLPGLSPAKAAHLAQQILQDPMSIVFETGLPLLAHANLMAAALEAADPGCVSSYISQFIKELASLVEGLKVEDVLRDINEDRAISGFPEIKAGDQIESELAERKRYFRNSISIALNQLSSSTVVDVMTRAVDDATAGGDHHAPELIDALVDSYEVEAQGFITKESESIKKLIEAARNSAKSGEETIKPLIDKMELVVRNWEKVARPITLSAKARGTRHWPSVELAFSIRGLGIDLFNEHRMLVQSKRLTVLLQEAFSESPELAERVEEDAEALEQASRDINKIEVQRQEWEREITYSADIGVFFKSRLGISPTGLSWKNQTYPLESITRLRWGGVRQSINGIPVGTSYTIAFGDGRSDAVVELKREDVFSTFVEKLWRAVGVRLLVDFLQALRSGKEMRFGRVVIRDEGISLPAHKFWGPDEEVRCTWSQVQVWNGDGAFHIGAKENKKAHAGLAYLEIPNVHVLEHAIRAAFQMPGMRALSDVLTKP